MVLEHSDGGILYIIYFSSVLRVAVTLAVQQVTNMLSKCVCFVLCVCFCSSLCAIRWTVDGIWSSKGGELSGGHGQ